MSTEKRFMEKASNHFEKEVVFHKNSLNAKWMTGMNLNFKSGMFNFT